MMARRQAATTFVALLVVAAACTDEVEIPLLGSPSTTSSSPSGRGLRVEPVDTGEATSAGAMKALCISPTPVSTDDGSAPEQPAPSIAEVQDQVESVRGLSYLEPVAAESVSSDEIAKDLTEAFDDTYPETFYDRRTVAWHTMGVIPRDVTIREALLAFQTGQVVGFYNPVDGQLVYRGDDELDLVERYTLAHELTHAIDDQHFELSRLDGIAAACRDEPFQAALGAVEGSAQFFATRVIAEFPDVSGGLGDVGGGGLPDGVPPFIAELMLWPYSAGQAFITALESRGELQEVDAALKDLPTTTEQIMHPELYPGRAPAPPNIENRARSLGPGWGDLDVMQVGEEWLSAMLDLSVEPGLVEDVAAGWNGGGYRAWTDGRDAAVLLRVSWDSVDDATVFASAMASWLESTGVTGSVADPADGRTVTVGFATSHEALAALEVSTGSDSVTVMRLARP